LNDRGKNLFLDVGKLAHRAGAARAPEQQIDHRRSQRQIELKQPERAERFEANRADIGGIGEALKKLRVRQLLAGDELDLKLRAQPRPNRVHQVAREEVVHTADRLHLFIADLSRAAEVIRLRADFGLPAIPLRRAGASCREE
jgi:hypothetical protein